MVTQIGERLREARMGLKKTQEEFGALGGVTKQAQIKYEKGERHPDTQYLTALGAAGVDIPYILLGNRKLAAQVGVDELPMLAAYREDRGPLRDTVRYLLLDAPPAVQQAVCALIAPHVIEKSR